MEKIKTLREVEDEYIVEVLKKLEGNRAKTTKALGVSLRTLRIRLKNIKLDRPDLVITPSIAGAKGAFKYSKESLDELYSHFLEGNFNYGKIRLKLGLSNTELHLALHRLRYRGYPTPPTKGTMSFAERRQVTKDFIANLKK